jgi:hypothetical protein
MDLDVIVRIAEARMTETPSMISEAISRVDAALSDILDGTEAPPSKSFTRRAIDRHTACKDEFVSAMRDSQRRRGAFDYFASDEYRLRFGDFETGGRLFDLIAEAIAEAGSEEATREFQTRFGGLRVRRPDKFF